MNISNHCPMFLTFFKLFGNTVHLSRKFHRSQKLCLLSCSKYRTADIGCFPKPPKYFFNNVYTKSDERCWSCGNTVSSLFCNNCKSLQRVNKDTNYFDLLELDCNFDLILPELTKKYRQLQSILHPDKFSNKSEEERAISEEYSSIINKAYSTLNNPIERGLYMLKMKGVTIDEGTIQLDPKFLMEIMEKNEEIEDEKDGKKLAEYKRTNKESMDLLIRELLAAFRNDDISAAKEILTKLKYYSRIDSKIKEIKQNLGIPD